MHAGSGHWCSSLPPTPAFPRMKTSNLNPNQDVYLRPKPQRHFKQAKFLTYFADQVQSFVAVIASLYPGEHGGPSCPTAWMGAGMVLWDPGTWWHLVVSSQTRAFQHIWVSTAQQCGGPVFGKLANDPTIAPTASLCSSGSWSSPAGRVQQLTSQLINKEEAIRKPFLHPYLPLVFLLGHI